jgi:hypothetical protein
MKVPLEPIPTEQIVLVEKDLPHAEIRVHERAQGAGRNDRGAQPPTQLEKAYPWLLGASTCLSAMLCWMYVTKPVIAVSNTGAPEETLVPVERTDDLAVAGADDAGVTPATGDLVPSDTVLPGAKPDVAEASGVVSVPGTPEAVDPQQLAAARAGGGASTMALGWEATNLKVQHILSANAGDGALEKIVINVPVLYQTRTMRWTPADVVKARNVLTRLMVYERNLSNLRQEGQVLLRDWNKLMEETVPAPALRADSPSLPYNHGLGGQRGGLPGSSSAIKVEH